MLYVFFRTIMKLRQTAAVLWLSILSLPAFAIDFGRIPKNEISVYAKNWTAEKYWSTTVPDVSVNPASTMKLVTAFAAFKALGSDYRWTTQFKSDGKIQGDTLQGDIYWVGSGDPVFDQEGLGRGAAAITRQRHTKNHRRLGTRPPFMGRHSKSERFRIRCRLSIHDAARPEYAGLQSRIGQTGTQ